MTPLDANDVKGGQLQNSYTVAILGFGYIGCVLGASLAQRGCEVVGIDSNPKILTAIERGVAPFNEPGLDELVAEGVRSGRLRATGDYSAIRSANVILVTVGTPLLNDGSADLSQIRAATESIAPFVHNRQTVILKSTVPPGTTADVVAPILADAAPAAIAFSPERLAEGRALEDLETVPIVVGGVDAVDTARAATFWRSVLDVPVIEVSTAEAAELVKLADNLWIDLNIALGNELAQLSDRLGLDALEIIRAANTLPKVDYNVNILLPSLGVGGYCLTKDPWFVHAFGRSLGLDLKTPTVSRRVNDAMPYYSVSLIQQHLSNTKPATSTRIAVLGLAFKNNTGDCRFTPTAPAISALRTAGFDVVVHDPWVSAEDASKVTDATREPDLATAIRGADCVAFFAGHREFHDLQPETIASLARPHALIFDGRAFFSRDKIEAFREAGLRYKGVGR